MRYQGIDDYSVMLTHAIVSVIFSFLFCLSVARLHAYSIFLCGVSVHRLQAEESFFLNFLCGSFLRHQHLTPSVTLFFLPNALESPTAFIHPLHLYLHSLAFLPVHAALNPETERECQHCNKTFMCVI